MADSGGGCGSRCASRRLFDSDERD